MLQHLTLKGVVQFSCKPKPVRLLVSLFFCALAFYPFFPIFGQEGVIQRVTTPITAPIQSVQSAISHSFTPSPPVPPASQVNSALPGLGTLARREPSNPPVFAGSLDFLPPGTAQIPQTYFGEGVTQTQFTPTQLLTIPTIPQTLQGSDPGFRRVQLTPRSDNPFGVRIEQHDPNDPARGGIGVLTGGVNLIIEGISVAGAHNVLAGDIVDISADNVVIWAENIGAILGGSSHTESDTLDLEVYLEGNIVYRDGPRVIRASRMYYDARHRVAYILDGDLTAPISEFGDISGLTPGHVRLRADILRQMGEGQFTARNAMVTTSQLGEPTYSLRSQTLRLDRRATHPFGTSEATYRQVLVAENNFVALRNLPIFYWPWIAADVEDPTFFLKNVSYGRSNRTGHTVRTLWDPFQILNVRRPDGVTGDVNVTWMEKRGIGHGATFQYGVPTCFHLPGPAHGRFIYWGIHDRGTDQLGGARNNVGFPDRYRHRLHWVHHQQAALTFPVLGGPWDMRAEIGKTSDRNFLNSYFNSVWHTEENATTAIDLTRQDRNRSFTLSAEYALDRHYTNANWLPRLEHFWLGESLFNDRVTWYQRTRVGLMNYHVASTPTDPVDHQFFRHLPWEEQGGGTGLVFSTRHELDLPIQAGAFKVVPYVLGDFSVWGEDQTGNATDRLYGQGGVRVNLPIWKVNPRISSRTWYVSGLAHKIDLNAEYMYGRANRSMGNLILTDPLDHWSIDDFRRRYLVTNAHFNALGSQMPRKFDPRYYALRSGMAGNVTAGNMEIADDMHMLRLGTTHRFQTKRGPVGNRRILDWITVSTHMNFYPQTEHNFGRNIGLLDYNILWHVGDRFSFFSEGLYDVFDDGQHLTRLGGIWNRPDRGSFSLMVDQLSGVVERTYLSLNVGYTMNEKYSMSYMTAYDIRTGQNVGHNLMLVRSGESFRFLVGAVYSEALSEWSFSVGLEPIFLRSTRRTFGTN